MGVSEWNPNSGPGADSGSTCRLLPNETAPQFLVLCSNAMTPERQWTVLLVDDSEDDRYLFAHSFRSAGVQGRILECEDGDAAIETLQHAHRTSVEHPWPDVVFLDLKMPRRDGFEVLKWVREAGFGSSLAIYVLSGSNEPSDVERAQELGSSEYITKPITEKKLRELFDRWASRSAKD
jgi:CheY-like chemotaxis protein